MQVPFNVPTKLSEIKLSDYQEFLKVKEGTEDNLFLRQKMIQIFCNVPLLAVDRMRKKDFTEISRALDKVFSQKPAFQKTFKLNQKEFGFVPNLDKIEVGAFIDLDKYIFEDENLHKAMAALYRPVISKKKEKYLSEEYEGSDKYADVLKDMPLDIAKGALVFFWTLGSQLLIITPRFLEKKLREKPQLIMDLEKNGVGINTYIHSLKEASLKLERLLNLQLASA